MAGKENFWGRGIYWSLMTESNKSGFITVSDARLKACIKEGRPNDVNFKAVQINDEDYLYYLLGVLNTRLIYKIKRNFINSSTANQQVDINHIPIVIPSISEKGYIDKRVKKCIELQEKERENIEFNSEQYTLQKFEEEIEKCVWKIYFKEN